MGLIEGVSTSPFRHVGFGDEYGAPGLKGCHGGIRLMRHVVSTNRRAVGRPDTADVVIVLDRYRKPNEGLGVFAGSICLNGLGLFESPLETAHGQRVDFVVHCLNPIDCRFNKLRGADLAPFESGNNVCRAHSPKFVR